MGERVLSTVQLLSKVVKMQAVREGKLTLRPLETRTPKFKIMIRRTGGGGVQLTRSAGVVGSDDEFSWC